LRADPVPDRSSLPDPSSPYWDADAQTTSNDDLAKLAEAGVRTEWERIWSLPVPFHRARLEAAGFSANDVPELGDIPRYTKNDLRADEAAHPPFGSHRTVGLREAVRIGGSTGTSGTPVFMMFGPNDLRAGIEFQCRMIWRGGIRPGDSFTHAWPQGFYISSTSTALWFIRTGVLEIPVGPPVTNEEAANHIRLWERLRPNAYQMTSSQLATYDVVAKELGIDLPELLAGTKIGLLDAIFQFEEPRKRIEAAYGFDMRNMGGVGDIPGYGLTDCAHHTGLHAPGDYSIVQAVDPETGREVPDGERGNLVITTFGLDGITLRYDFEDIVTVTHEPCPCGETGPRYTLYGRAMDIANVDGKKILPIDVQLALDDHGAPEFQFAPGAEQNGSSVRLKVEGEGRASEVASLIHDALGVPADVEEIPVGSLPRPSFKPRRVAS
jgi:phenylacetate-CoA ligase